MTPFSPDSDGAVPRASHSAACSPCRSVSRLSLQSSRKFASTFQTLMKECRLPSVYALFLYTDFPLSTIKRWLSGQVRIPVEGAQRLIEALIEYAAQLSTNESLHELDALVRAECEVQSDEARLRAELRARRVPISRTLEALRAASLLPPEANAQ